MPRKQRQFSANQECYLRQTMTDEYAQREFLARLPDSKKIPKGCQVLPMIFMSQFKFDGTVILLELESWLMSCSSLQFLHMPQKLSCCGMCKNYSDNFIRIHMRAKQTNHRIWITMKQSLVKWAPGSTCGHRGCSFPIWLPPTGLLNTQNWLHWMWKNTLNLIFIITTVWTNSSVTT